MEYNTCDPQAPEISVIVAAYNAADTLEACLHSILNQTMADLEIIVIDDRSKDTTLEVARRAAGNDARIRVIAQPVNCGPGAARNAGLDAARGRWIAVVDSDDTIEAGRLAAMIDTAGRYNADVVLDNLNYISSNGKADGLYLDAAADVFGPMPLARYIRSHIYGSNDPVLGFLKPLIRRDVIEQHGVRYQPELPIGEDTMLILQLYVRGAAVFIMRDAYYNYYRRPGSISYVFDIGAAERYNLGLASFVGSHLGGLSETDRKAMIEFQQYSEDRLAAKKMISTLTMGKLMRVIPAVFGSSLQSSLMRHYLVVDLRQALKKKFIAARNMVRR